MTKTWLHSNVRVFGATATPFTCQVWLSTLLLLGLMQTLFDQHSEEQNLLASAGVTPFESVLTPHGPLLKGVHVVLSLLLLIPKSLGEPNVIVSYTDITAVIV